MGAAWSNRRSWISGGSALLTAAVVAAFVALVPGALLAESSAASGASVEVQGEALAALSPAERLAEFLSDPLVSALLLSLGIFALIFAFKMPGTGVPEFVAALAIGAFLFGKYTAGFAGWEDMVLVAIGILLLALEIFVIPGIGVAALAGALALAAGLIMAAIGHPVDSPYFWEEFRSAIAMLGIAVGLALLWSVFAYLALRKTALWKRFTMRAALAPPAEGPLVDLGGGLAGLEGKAGTAKTSLRPEGEVEIGGKSYPARAERAYLDPNAAVTVISHDGQRLVVREDAGDGAARASQDQAVHPNQASESGSKTPRDPGE